MILFLTLTPGVSIQDKLQSRKRLKINLLTGVVLRIITRVLLQQRVVVGPLKQANQVLVL